MTREQAALRAQIEANRKGMPHYVLCFDGTSYHLSSFLPPKGAYQSYMCFEPNLGTNEVIAHTQTMLKSPNSWKGHKR